MAHTSPNFVNIGSDNGLFPEGIKPISEPMVTSFQLKPSGKSLNKNIDTIRGSFVFEHDVCKMATILLKPQWLNNASSKHINSSIFVLCL